VSFRALEGLGEGQLVGNDLSEKMVGLASALSLQKGETRTRFLRMDAEELGLDDESFDVALCALGLMYMPDVLSPGQSGHVGASFCGRWFLAYCYPLYSIDPAL
jgi:ubiquinone/menaquinone biosynthesis C-methylase UbiE